MAIKNYTTKVDVYQSLGEIQASLAQHGARKVMVDYDEEGTPSEVAFGILTPEPIDLMTDDPLKECLSCPDHVSKAQEDMERFYGKKE